MTELNHKPGDQSAGDDSTNHQLQEKLISLEKDLLAIEQSKKQRNLVSLVGLLLVILAIVMFMMNLSSFVKGKMNDNQFKKELLTKLSEDMKEIQANPNLQGMIADLKSDILPNLSKEILTHFKKDAPKFQANGENFAKELQDYLENDIKERLVKSLSMSLIKVESAIKEKYPMISADDLSKVLKIAQEKFIIEVTGIIDAKIDLIRLDIENLKKSVNKFKDCEEYKKLNPNDPDTIKAVKFQMVESMLELVIFQMNPGKGNVNYVGTLGGVK